MIVVPDSFIGAVPPPVNLTGSDAPRLMPIVTVKNRHYHRRTDV